MTAAPVFMAAAVLLSAAVGHADDATVASTEFIDCSRLDSHCAWSAISTRPSFTIREATTEQLKEGDCLKVVNSELVIVPCGCAAKDHPR